MANLQDIVNRSEVGAIKPWGKATAPAGYVLCDGAAISRTDYADLFAVISTTYGAGNGSTTFNVPDLQDNVAVSKSNNKALASTGGANTVAATGNIAGSTANASLTTAQLASHSHSGSCNFTPCQEGTQARGVSNNTGNTGSGSAHSHNMSANFTGDATSVVQPYLTVLYIIKT